MDATVAQFGFSRASRRMRARMLRMVGGRPGRFGRDARPWRLRRRSRCQRRMVSGEMIRWNVRSVGLGMRCGRAARNARSGGVRRGLGMWRCRMASWWRRTMISVSLSVLLVGSNRSNANTPVRARLGSRSTTDHPDVPGYWRSLRPGNSQVSAGGWSFRHSQRPQQPPPLPRHRQRLTATTTTAIARPQALLSRACHHKRRPLQPDHRQVEYPRQDHAHWPRLPPGRRRRARLPAVLLGSVRPLAVEPVDAGR